MVADLIQVKKQYETAIETALSSNVQNIVTEDEETAKRMIRYLKENRYGRATFLPLTSVGKKNRAEIMRQSRKKVLSAMPTIWYQMIRNMTGSWLIC